jgi:hypothetical protein
MNVSAERRMVHLVGSVPFRNEDEVFRTASEILGDYIKRIPDGETGSRGDWIGWQTAVLARSPSLKLLPGVGKDWGLRICYDLRPGIDATAVTFENLGYADAALASYETFARLKGERVIRSSTRFQVCLPTPLATISAYVTVDSRAVVESAYKAQLLAELGRICSGIPHDQLAIQWDTAIEFAILEGIMPSHLAEPWQDIIERLVGLGDPVPAEVELGYHLCYGDADHQHFVQPKDASLLVAVANAICGGVRRGVNWIHLPVPREREDAAYFAPLKELNLSPETELYLGLVHFTDGVEGTRRRMRMAAQTVEEFGIGTECGLGRRPADTVAPLLHVHREAARGHASSSPAHSGDEHVW